MAYLVRRLLENTANESFLRASFNEHVPEERLLMNPHLKARGKNQGSGVRGQGSGDKEQGFHNEPLSDFSREDVQQAMHQALKQAAVQLGRHCPPVIKNVPVETAATFDSINPGHLRQVVGRCGRATVEQANEAVGAARDAFPGWRDTSAKGRTACLFRAAAIMRRRRFELAAWQVYECGKPWREADADVAEAIDYCDYYAEEMLRLAEPQHRDVPGEVNEYFYEPRGVAVVIAPWNFPLAILCGMTAAALATGNTAIMKPAEQSTVMGA